jgi:ribose-phosphate pyrophosphokinase
MRPLLIALPGNNQLVEGLATALDADIGRVAIRRFPDEETYLRFETPLSGRSLILLCTLDRPDNKFLPLMFAAAAARDLQAASVGLVAPYLAYMRQDRRFQPGEAVTSTCFARLLSSQIDWMVTVDPHLHRRGSLAEIYGIPTPVVHAAPLISDWIRNEVKMPLLVGPDSESEQWAAIVARDAEAPYVVLRKERHGDRDVEVSIPDVARWRDHTPVLVDDIVSTGRTMIETIGHLKREGMRPSVCVAVHGVFVGSAASDLMAAGAGKVVTTNTIPHETNAIDVIALLAQGVRAVAA